MNLHTIKSGWSIFYIKGSQDRNIFFYVFQENNFLSLKVEFVLANIADHDAMLHYSKNLSGISSECRQTVGIQIRLNICTI